MGKYMEFTEHTSTDRWPEDYCIKKLRGRPKDGCWIWGLSGTLLRVAVQLTVTSLPLCNWANTGTRHMAGLRAAGVIPRGAVMIRSESGQFHLLTARSVKQGVGFALLPSVLPNSV